MEIRRYVVGPIEANCYVVWDEGTKEAAVIDPGAPDKRVEDCIITNGLKVTKILLTHGHFDHIGGVGRIRELTGAPVYIYEDDADCLMTPAANLSMMMGVTMQFDPAENCLHHGDILTIGSIRLKVLHTPGHTAGGACFIGDDFMFTGDTLFAGSIGRSDFPGGSYQQLINSVHMLAQYDESTKVYPGHGPESTIGRELMMNPFIHR